MALKHADIWRAIDRLAQQHHMSPSRLARKAGLDATAFNPSKRISGKRKRWPSTESIARILQVTQTGLDTFMALTRADDKKTLAVLPLVKPRKNDAVAIRTRRGKIMTGTLKRLTAQTIELMPSKPSAKPLLFKRRDVDWVYRTV